MQVLYIKIIILLTILISSLVLGSLPWKIVSRMSPDRNFKTNVILSMGNCFSGGVFLCVTFLHLLPHVREDFSSAFHQLSDSEFLEHYPMAELIFVIGFFIVLFIEQMVLHYKDPEVIETLGRYRRANGVILDDEDADNREITEGLHDDTTSIIRSIVLLIALSLHSVFEGLAIGLQNSEKELWHVLAAVISHKFIMAFTFGLNVSQTKIRLRSFIIIVVIFAISSPIGIGIGCGITSLPHSSIQYMAQVILTGLAGGTFLFVTFFEIISKEFTRIGSCRPLKFMGLVIGFIGMSSLLVMHTHE